MPGGTQKYEREIAEILERLDRKESRSPTSRNPPVEKYAPPPKRIPTLNLDLGFARFGRFAATWRWIGLTVAAGIVGAIVQRFIPFLGAAFGLLMVLIFFSPLLGAMQGGPQRATAQVWRGQVIDLPPRGGILSRVSYHWRRFQRKRH